MSSTTGDDIKIWSGVTNTSPRKAMIAVVPDLMPWRGKSLSLSKRWLSACSVNHASSPSQFKHGGFTRGQYLHGSRTGFYHNSNILNSLFWFLLALTFFSIPLKNWNIVMLAGGLDMPKAMHMPFSSWKTSLPPPSCAFLGGAFTHSILAASSSEMRYAGVRKIRFQHHIQPS